MKYFLLEAPTERDAYHWTEKKCVEGAKLLISPKGIVKHPSINAFAIAIPNGADESKLASLGLQIKTKKELRKAGFPFGFWESLF